MESAVNPSTFEVEVTNTQAYLDVAPGTIGELARRVLAREGVTRASVSIALVDDATIHVLNRRHLQHDWPTDVITFPLSDDRDEVLTGEVIVSAEMAARTAQKAGVDPLAELSLYVVHGLLHLCGYDDQTDRDRTRIRRREDEILAGEGLTNTFPLVGLADAADAERESVRWAV